MRAPTPIACRCILGRVSDTETGSTAPKGALRLDDLAATTVQDQDGKDRKIGEAWAGRTAVLAFLRHFG